MPTDRKFPATMLRALALRGEAKRLLIDAAALLRVGSGELSGVKERRALYLRSQASKALVEARS